MAEYWEPQAEQRLRGIVQELQRDSNEMLDVLLCVIGELQARIHALESEQLAHQRQQQRVANVLTFHAA